MNSKAIRPVYYDCDTGVDDAMGLAYLMLSPEIQLVGVGTVSGNIDAAQAAVNTLDLLAMGGRDDVAVAVGAMNPLARPFTGGVPHIHGRNGVGNVELPHTEKQPENESAADMLVRLAHEHEGELVVIAIGPLTNLALALQQYTGVSDVDFATVWGLKHTMAERTGDSTANFISWVADCVSA